MGILLEYAQMTYKDLKKLATDAEILYTIRAYDAEDMSLVQAYFHVKDNDPKFSALCDKLESIRHRGRHYNKVLSDIADMFVDAADRCSVEVFLAPPSFPTV